MSVYIRYPGKSWECGETHHRGALFMYLSLYHKNLDPGELPSAGDIFYPRDHGVFIAKFSPINEIIYQFKEFSGAVAQITFEPPVNIGA